MTPTIVVQEGMVRLVTGSPGGRTIPNTVLWVVLNVLEFQRSPREAVDAVRTHHQWFPDVLRLEGEDWDVKTVEGLRGRGHEVVTGGIQGTRTRLWWTRRRGRSTEWRTAGGRLRPPWATEAGGSKSLLRGPERGSGGIKPWKSREKSPSAVEKAEFFCMFQAVRPIWFGRICGRCLKGSA